MIDESLFVTGWCPQEVPEVPDPCEGNYWCLDDGCPPGCVPEEVIDYIPPKYGACTVYNLSTGNRNFTKSQIVDDILIAYAPRDGTNGSIIYFYDITTMTQLGYINGATFDAYASSYTYFTNPHQLADGSFGFVATGYNKDGISTDDDNTAVRFDLGTRAILSTEQITLEGSEKFIHGFGDNLYTSQHLGGEYIGYSTVQAIGTTWYAIFLEIDMLTGTISNRVFFRYPIKNYPAITAYKTSAGNYIFGIPGYEFENIIGDDYNGIYRGIGMLEKYDTTGNYIGPMRERPIGVTAHDTYNPGRQYYEYNGRIFIPAGADQCLQYNIATTAALHSHIDVFDATTLDYITTLVDPYFTDMEPDYGATVARSGGSGFGASITFYGNFMYIGSPYSDIKSFTDSWRTESYGRVLMYDLSTIAPVFEKELLPNIPVGEGAAFAPSMVVTPNNIYTWYYDYGDYGDMRLQVCSKI